MDFRYARPPPPPPPSSDPHQRPPQQPVPPPPGTWYSGQFQYHSSSPPPPQWAPQTQHSDHQLPHPYAVAPPPPMPYSSSPYPLPPRPHMTVPPPHPHYPPHNQEWSNTNRGHQGWDPSAPNKNEDDWAARARAWAASKTVTDDQHQQSHSIPANRPEETNYQDQYTQNLNPPYTESQQHSLPPSSYQQYPSSLQEPSSFTSGYTSDGNSSYTTRDGNAAFPHQEPAPTSLSAQQQEVPSSYSSIPGKEESNGNFYQPSSHMPSFASAPQHQIQPPISPVSIEHYSFSNPTTTTDVSNQPLDFVPRFSHDHDPIGATSTGMHPVTSFGRMPPGNTTFPIGTSNAFGGFPVDTYGFPDRNKKNSVPNWLREEIIKKAVIGSSTMEVSRQETESNEDEVMVDGKSMESTEEEEDDEDYVEAARTAAIKRILTEVLLKVTDELFDEIATKVLEEDTLAVKVEHKSIASRDMVAPIPTPKSSAKVLIPSKTKGDDTSRNSNSNSSLPGDVLGLGSYASDDDDDEVQKLSIPSSINNNKPAENGTSQVDGNKFLEKENGNLESKSPCKTDHDVTHDDSGYDEKVLSDAEHQVVVDGVANNSLPDDLQGENNNKRSSSKDKNEEVEKAHTKVVEGNNGNNKNEDERHIEKAIKKDDRNGSKDKIKDQESGKRSDKKEIERDRRKSHHDKEDGRKRERTKDERSSSSRHKRHHSYASTDTSSDDSRRRKGRSKRRNSSPSPVRSRRQVSRSPPSKRSQHNRHSKYSSLETSRERKRSRSRSRR